MKTTNRFVNSIVATATKTQPMLPWTRGNRRAAFIASRREAAQIRKTA